MPIVRTPEERFADLPSFDYEPSFVDVGGPEMAYVDEGSGEETFLCLHGEPTWSFLYRKMLPTLAERGRVVAPDFVGFGRSDKYTDPESYTYEGFYDQLEAFVEALDLDAVTLVCQDWGGLLGLPVAANNPDRFARLVPMNTGLPTGRAEMPEVWYDFKELVETAPDLDVGRIVAGATVSELEEAVLDGYRAPFHDESSMAGARTWPDLYPTETDDPAASVIADARDEFRDWTDPVYVLFGDSDPITHAARDDLRSLFPTATEQPDRWIEGAGHFLQEDAGDRVATEIVDFVDRTN